MRAEDTSAGFLLPGISAPREEGLGLGLGCGASAEWIGLGEQQRMPQKGLDTYIALSLSPRVFLYFINYLNKSLLLLLLLLWMIRSTI